MCSWGTPGQAATPETPQFPKPGIHKGWGAAPGDPHGVMPFPWVVGLGIPHGQGKTPSGNCAPQARFGGLVPAPEHPTPRQGRALGSLPQCLVWQRWLRQEQGLCHPPASLHGPAGTCGQEGKRVRAPTDPALGTQGWVTRRGSTVGHWISPPSHAAPSLHLIYLGYILLPLGAQQAPG